MKINEPSSKNVRVVSSQIQKQQDSLSNDALSFTKIRKTFFTKLRPREISVSVFSSLHLLSHFIFHSPSPSPIKFIQIVLQGKNEFQAVHMGCFAVKETSINIK
ncbi:hypothetical protein L6164_036856 [Bauhinia variegata]|uniref:Uncharacterized protein n=1 Tax=Bauhinia variegata TaxID=167791 RepID=A0ACB9KIA6_BAUVA|nr:hypothetical protein L6164_036856 [Bauhinia variegata]